MEIGHEEYPHEVHELEVAIAHAIRHPRISSYDEVRVPDSLVSNQPALQHIRHLVGNKTFRRGEFGLAENGDMKLSLFHPEFAKEYLLILPCNPGALVGNYYEGNFWAAARRILLSDATIGDQLDVCAVDSIMTFIAPDGIGPLVHEREMWRVYGHDFHPNEKVNPAQSNNYIHIHTLADSLKLAINRVLPCYKHVFALLTVRGYRLAFTIAAKETVGFDKLYIEDQPSACFRRIPGLGRVAHLLRGLPSGSLPSGIYHTFPHASEYSPEWKEQMVYGWRNKLDLPGRFKYWTWPEYRDHTFLLS